MSKLMEHVRAIQAKAHVCPECNGEKTFFAKGVVSNRCWVCDGTGQVDAPDIDALVGAIEALEKFLEADRVATDHVLSCPVCRDKNNDVCDKGEQLFMDKRFEFLQSLALVCNGLPGEEADTRC
jgi:hypothetical protein